MTFLMNILLPLLILGALGILFGCLLGFASKKFAVEQDPLFGDVRGCLPGANCGACGYAGCDAYAKAVVAGEAPTNRCSVGGQLTADEISLHMGVVSEEMEKMVALVGCHGTCEIAPDKAAYYGISDCREAAILPGGGVKACAYGCMGFGSCVSACQFDAIHVENGIAVVNEEKCTGCGACTKVCPKMIIHLIPASQHARLVCSNKDKGKDVRVVCSAGCSGCSLCSKVCPNEAVIMENNLPKIVSEKCGGCGLCAEKCPSKVLVVK